MGLIDDEVRRSFPGFSDQQILDFFEVAKSVEVEIPTLLESDLSHAKIIKCLGWVAFKEYLLVTVGTDYLDGEDIVALVNAVGYLDDIEQMSLYNAMYSSASEMQSKKTASARKKSYKALVGSMAKFNIDSGL